MGLGHDSKQAELEYNVEVLRGALDELLNAADPTRFATRLATHDATIAKLEARLEEAYATRQRCVDLHDRATPDRIATQRRKLKDAEAELYAHKHQGQVDRLKKIADQLRDAGIDPRTLT